MKYDSFEDLFNNVVSIKEFAIHLNIDKRAKFKHSFFSLSFDEWKLNLIWEFIWDDKTYDEIYYVFSQKKLIKRNDQNEH